MYISIIVSYITSIFSTTFYPTPLLTDFPSNSSAGSSAIASPDTAEFTVNIAPQDFGPGSAPPLCWRMRFFTVDCWLWWRKKYHEGKSDTTSMASTSENQSNDSNSKLQKRRYRGHTTELTFKKMGVPAWWLSQNLLDFTWIWKCNFMMKRHDQVFCSSGVSAKLDRQKSCADFSQL